MLLEIYEKGILTFKTVALYFYTITAFSFIISCGGMDCKKKRREHIVYVCLPPASIVIFDLLRGAPPPPYDYAAASSIFSMKMP